MTVVELAEPGRRPELKETVPARLGLGAPACERVIAHRDDHAGRDFKLAQSVRKDTVIFVLEDDAQAGPDHTDSHRAPFYAISAYKRPGTVRRFINTTDVIAAIEDILGMGRLSKFDYFSRSLADIFAPVPDLTPYDPIIPTQGLNEKNPQNTAAARLSEGFDLSAPDRVDDQFYNRILWLMLKGDVPAPVAQSRAALHAMQSSK